MTPQASPFLGPGDDGIGDPVSTSVNVISMQHHRAAAPPDLRHAIDAAARWSIDAQKPDGHWVGAVESNACMEAQWCLGLWVVGLEHHPLRQRLAAALLQTQRPDGSWQVYYGAPEGDINATVEAYAALRSMGTRRGNRKCNSPAAGFSTEAACGTSAFSRATGSP